MGQWQGGERGRRNCWAEKLCCVRPNIFLICLVWNSSFSDSGFVTFSEGSGNIWTPYGLHLHSAKRSCTLFSKPVLSPSIAAYKALNISTTDYNITSSALSLFTSNSIGGALTVEGLLAGFLPHIHNFWGCFICLFVFVRDDDNTMEHRESSPAVVFYTEGSCPTKMKNGNRSSWCSLG